MRSPLYTELSFAMVGGLAGAALLLLIVMLRTVIGPFTVTGSLPELEYPRVALLVPPSLPPEAGIELVRSVWRELLPETVATAASLADAATAQAIVVAEARWLGADELLALERFARRGGSVLVAGFVGVRAEEGVAAGLERMARLLGTASIARVRGTASRSLARSRAGLLAGALAPDERVVLGSEPELPAVAGPAELVWSGEDGRAIDGPAGAARRIALGRGRLLWLGPTPASLAGNVTATERMRRVVDAGMAWLLRQPFVEMDPRSPSCRSRVRLVGPRRALIEVTNTSEAAQSPRMRVYLNRAVQDVELSVTQLFQAPAKLSLDSAAEQMDLELPELEPGTTASYFADLVPPGR